MSHWIHKYIGLKHVPGARGPREVDCWGLLCLIYAEIYGISLPLFPGATLQPIGHQTAEIQKGLDEDWVESLKPFDGAAVGMSQSKAIHHVGIYVTADSGKIIHCQNGSNVIADSPRSLKLKGFSTIRYFRHNLWPT